MPSGVYAWFEGYLGDLALGRVVAHLSEEIDKFFEIIGLTSRARSLQSIKKWK